MSCEGLKGRKGRKGMTQRVEYETVQRFVGRVMDQCTAGGRQPTVNTMMQAILDELNRMERELREATEPAGEPAHRD